MGALTWASCCCKSWRGRESSCEVSISFAIHDKEKMKILRGPPGGPPRPPKPGGNPPGGNPNPPGGAGPPTPAAGPVRPTGKPLPAGLLIPGPAASVGGTMPVPPGALVPNLADGSAGGGPSTEQETICVPRTIVRPSVRFSSDSTSTGAVLPGADWAPLVGLRLTRRNSSVSARTIFMCYTKTLAYRTEDCNCDCNLPCRRPTFVRSFDAHRSV